MSKGGGSSAPAPVDPYEAAQAQYQYGAATANYNTELARPNINTPYGSVDWTQGTQPSGQGAPPINVPGYGMLDANGYVQPTYSGGYGPIGGSGLPVGGGGGGYGGYPSNWGPGATSTGGFNPGGSTQPISPSQGASGGVAPYAGPTRTPVERNNLFENLTTGGTSALLNPSGPDTAGEGYAAGNDPYQLTPATTLTAPQWTQNMNLSPAQQQLLDLQEGTQISSGLTGQNLAGEAAANLSTPIQNTPVQTSINTSGVSAIPGASDLAGFTNQAQQAAYTQQTQYLDPQFAQAQEQLESQLTNSGAQPGDPAWTNAMTLFNNQKQQAYQSASNNAVQQGLTEQQALYGEGANTNQQQFGEAATQESAANTGEAQTLAQELQVRDQPLSELQTEYGLSQPNTSALTGATGLGGGTASTPDILDAFNTSAQQQEANYNAGVAQSNATEGAAASLASSYLMYLALA